jgi:hypothetical protein
LPIMEGLDYRKKLKVTGLILEKTKTNNRYRRAGVFQASRRHPGDKRHYDFRRPSYSSHQGKTKERASEISGTTRHKRRRSSKDVEVDGRIVTSQSPVFKFDTVGGNLCLDHDSREKNLQVTADSQDWFFFPDSLSKQDQPLLESLSQNATDINEISTLLSTEHQDGADNGHQIPIINEGNFHNVDGACYTGVPISSSGRSILSAESNSDKNVRKRQREEDEPDGIYLAGSKHLDPGDDDSSGSVSDKEFSDDSDDDADDEAIEELTSEEQEARMRKEWVECIVTII